MLGIPRPSSSNLLDTAQALMFVDDRPCQTVAPSPIDEATLRTHFRPVPASHTQKQAAVVAVARTATALGCSSSQSIEATGLVCVFLARQGCNLSTPWATAACVSSTLRHAAVAGPGDTPWCRSVHEGHTGLRMHLPDLLGVSLEKVRNHRLFGDKGLSRSPEA